MDKSHNVFISWSGERSGTVAEFLHKWLPSVIQRAKPWLSTINIDKGSRSQEEILKALQGTKCGITCLTPENLSEPWILFEAGALLKTISEKPRLCTYLLGGLRPQDVPPPLGWFQATKTHKEDTRRLLQTINIAVSNDNDPPVPDENLNQVFDALWPGLERTLNNLPPADQPAPPKREVEDMVAEILEFTRAETNRRKETEDYEKWVASLGPSFRYNLVAGPTSLRPMYSIMGGDLGSEPQVHGAEIVAPPPTQAAPPPTRDISAPSKPSEPKGPKGPAPPPTRNADEKAE